MLLPNAKAKPPHMTVARGQPEPPDIDWPGVRVPFLDVVLLQRASTKDPMRVVTRIPLRNSTAVLQVRQHKKTEDNNNNKR